METNALARYKIFFFFFAGGECHVYTIVVSYRWLIDNQMDRTFHIDPFMAHLRGWLERRLSISRSNPTNCNLLYMENNTTKGGHRILYGREKNFV